MTAPWLDGAPRAARTGLIVGSIAVLASATVGLGAATTEPAWLVDLLAIGVVLGVGATWTAAWRRLGDGATRVTPDGHRHEAIAAWSERTPIDRLAANPRFSLPVWASEVRRLAGSGVAACPRLLDTTPDPAGIRARVAVREPGRVRVLTVLVSASGTALVDEQPGTELADPPVVADPSWPAARRALIARDGAFDVEAFEALAREISSAIDAGDEALGPYLTDDGALDLAYWRIVGLPPGGEDVAWLEIEQDGVFDRIELRVGGRVLSLRRPAATSEAPWELWRLRGAR